MARNRKNISVTLPGGMVEFIQGEFFEKTLIKPSQIFEKALENWMKENGYWEQYQSFLAEAIL